MGFITCCNLYGQADTVFCYTYGGIQNDVCNQIKSTDDGGYIMIGTSNSFGCGNTDFYAVKIDSLGRHEWSKSYGGIENEEGFSVTQTFDKGYAFLGFTDSYGAGGYDVYLVKTDSMGNFQWQRTYGGSDWDFGYSIQQLSDSGFIMCGLTYSYGSGNGNVYVIRTDKIGNALWTTAVVDTNYYEYYSVGNSICVEKDFLYAIVGNFSPKEGDTNAYVVLINNKGIVKKTTTYGIKNNHYGNSINKTLDNGFIIFGATDSAELGKPDEMLLKLDSVGQMQWMQVYTSAGYSIGHDAMQSPDGSYVAISTSNAYGIGGFAMRVWHIDATGTPLCAPSHGGKGAQQGNSLTIAGNGNVAFAGASNSPGFTEGLYDIMLVQWKSDSLINTYPFTIKNFYDTCFCTLGVESQDIIHPEVRIFPNPVSSSATLLVQGDMGEDYFFNLYNEQGECILYRTPLQSTNRGQSIAHIERSNLPPGIYICEILNGTGTKVASGKIIMQ